MKIDWALILSLVLAAMCTLLFFDRMMTSPYEAHQHAVEEAKEASMLGLISVAPDRKSLESMVEEMPVSIKKDLKKAKSIGYKPQTAIKAVSRDKVRRVEVDAVVARTKSGAAILTGRSRVYKDGKLVFDRPFEVDSKVQVAPVRKQPKNRVSIVTAFDGKKFSIGPSYSRRVAGPVWVSASATWNSKSAIPATVSVGVGFEF